MNIVAVIPARGGSKRMPRKNIALVLGRPMIAWSISAASASRYLGPGRVYVSTDDAEIAATARAAGAIVIDRPAELGADHVWTEPVIRHAVEAIEKQGIGVDGVVWMNACIPEVLPEDVDRVVERMLAENLREVFTVDANLRQISAARVLRRETLFQNRLSVNCGVEIRDYLEVHTSADVERVEQRLIARGAAPAAPSHSLVLDDSDWSEKAWMSQLDANLFERIVVRKARQANRRLEVLEWGGGRSTLYMTRLLENLGLPYRWLALEHDREYFREALLPNLPDNGEVTYQDEAKPPLLSGEGDCALQIVVFDAGKVQPFLPGHESDRAANLDDYVAYPGQLGRSFDLILVDGRKRRRCLLAAAGLMNLDGLTLLHDAYRTHYQCAFAHFRSQRMLGEILWVGSQANTNFIEWVA